jgi:hypothetical protein
VILDAVRKGWPWLRQLFADSLLSPAKAGCNEIDERSNFRRQTSKRRKR